MSIPSKAQRFLVRCRDLDEYQQAIAAHGPDSPAVPLLGQASLLGFPANLEQRALPDRAPLPAPPGERERVILALDEPHCRAAASLLARATDRRLELADAHAWTERLDALIHERPRSLALVVPSWDEQGRPSPRWLGKILLCMRERHEHARALAWGIVTANDPLTLTQLVAKALLQREIIEEYAQAQALLFTNGNASAGGIDLPAHHADRDAALVVADDGDVASKRSLTLVDRRWSLLFFKGHGRAYCACQGHLCGARSLTQSPLAQLDRCVLGMECASPRDDAYRPGFPAFPRIDPRRYDAPVVVMDCCGTGNWSFPIWAEGIPAVSFHALAGHASAVLTGDQVTMGHTGSHLDVLWALATGDTLGDAVARLNHTRPEAAARFPYFLLGDPELPAGRSRWPGWFVDAEPGTLPSTPDAPFVRVRLPGSIERQTLFIASDEPQRIRGARLMHHADGSDLVLSRASAREPGPTIDLDPRPSLALAPDLLATIASLEARTGAWAPALRPAAAILIQASERVKKVAAKLRGLERRAVLGRPSDFETARELALSGWIDAHVELVRAAIDHFAPGGLWPYRLWPIDTFEGESCPLPCPNCGLAPTLLRGYSLPPASRREQWECVQCVLLQDRPCAAMPELIARLPGKIEPGQTLVAEVELDNRRSERARYGAAMVLVDLRAHGVEPSPASPTGFTLPAGESLTLRFELSLPGAPPIAHLYYLRALLAIDGEWWLANRPILVAP